MPQHNGSDDMLVNTLWVFSGFHSHEVSVCQVSFADSQVLRILLAGYMKGITCQPG